MEDRYRNHVTKNLVDMSKHTICNSHLISRLAGENIISYADKEVLELPMLTPFYKSKKLNEIFQTRADSYHILMRALRETTQNGALKILAEQCCSTVQKIFVHGDLTQQDANGDNGLFLVEYLGGQLA